MNVSFGIFSSAAILQNLQAADLRKLYCFFYCASAKLVIEVDCSQHYKTQGMDYDSERSSFLNDLGLEVLRFSNRDIDRNFQGVCGQIDLTVKERL